MNTALQPQTFAPSTPQQEFPPPEQPRNKKPYLRVHNPVQRRTTPIRFYECSDTGLNVLLDYKCSSHVLHQQYNWNKSSCGKIHSNTSVWQDFDSDDTFLFLWVLYGDIYRYLLVCKLFSENIYIFADGVFYIVILCKFCLQCIPCKFRLCGRKDRNFHFCSSLSCHEYIASFQIQFLSFLNFLCC